MGTHHKRWLEEQILIKFLKITTFKIAYNNTENTKNIETALNK